MHLSNRDFSMCIISCSLDKAEVYIRTSSHRYQVLDVILCRHTTVHKVQTLIFLASLYPPLYPIHRLKLIFYLSMVDVELALKFQLCLCTSLFISNPFLEYWFHILVTFNLIEIKNLQNYLISTSSGNIDSQEGSPTVSETVLTHY